MTTIVYTRHAAEKLGEQEPKRLGITKTIIEKTVLKPERVDTADESVCIAMGTLSDRLTLCVVYREDDDGIHIITFFPARKGRYESKVLS